MNAMSKSDKAFCGGANFRRGPSAFSAMILLGNVLLILHPWYAAKHTGLIYQPSKFFKAHVCNRKIVVY